MTGPAIAVANDPADPMSPSASAPPRGKRSAVMPSMVGHQKAVPMASSAAAAKAICADCACAKSQRPEAARGAVQAISDRGAKRRASGAPNWRNSQTMPLIQTSTNTPACVLAVHHFVKDVAYPLTGPEFGGGREPHTGKENQEERMRQRTDSIGETKTLPPPVPGLGTLAPRTSPHR